MASRVRAKSLAPVLLLLAALALTASACSDGPGNEDDLISSLTRDDAFTQKQAECITKVVFDTWGDDDEILGRLSGADSYQDLADIDGFVTTFEGAIKACANVG